MKILHILQFQSNTKMPRKYSKGLESFNRKKYVAALSHIYLAVLLYLFTCLRSLLNILVWIFGKSFYQMTSCTIFFSNSRSIERSGLIIETLEQVDELVG